MRQFRGRICAVADVFDALTTDQPYRVATAPEEALALMVAERGSHFDPRLLDLLVDTFDDVLTLWRGFRAEAGTPLDPADLFSPTRSATPGPS